MYFQTIIELYVWCINRISYSKLKWTFPWDIYIVNIIKRAEGERERERERDEEGEREMEREMMGSLTIQYIYPCLLQRILIMYSVSTVYHTHSGPGHSPRTSYVVNIIKRAEREKERESVCV